ncbi:MAG: F0F1 ATP synthase subunit delta [Patescibacteria group bacterium]|nr:F0F1 ATP synthase subunit delta [Patescibacteria group bacterium]
MIYSSSEYAEALYLSIREKSDEEAGKAVGEFVESMKGRGLLALLPEILKAMPAAVKRMEGTEDVLVETAHEISDDIRNEAIKVIGKKEDEVEISTRVNPDLLGGIKVRGKDTLYDATLKNKLGRMRDAFVKS